MQAAEKQVPGSQGTCPVCAHPAHAGRKCGVQLSTVFCQCTGEKPKAAAPKKEKAWWRKKGPKKLTPKVVDDILLSVEAGTSLDVAARVSGIHPDTLAEWIRRGREEESGIYRLFSSAVEEAKARCQDRLVTIVANAAAVDPRWATWLLSKKWPREFGDRVQHVVESEMNALLDVAQAVLPQEYYVLLLAELTARSGGGTAPLEDVPPRLVGGGVSDDSGGSGGKP